MSPYKRALSYKKPTMSLSEPKELFLNQKEPAQSLYYQSAQSPYVSALSHYELALNQLRALTSRPKDITSLLRALLSHLRGLWASSETL